MRVVHIAIMIMSAAGGRSRMRTVMVHNNLKKACARFETGVVRAVPGSPLRLSSLYVT
jgi:hypothetical protein